MTQLSSGERKRAAIGLALLAQTRVLLLDGPTTELDKAMSAVIVDYIVRVTRKTGVMCLTTLHQPASAHFSSLDDLLLLSGLPRNHSGGRRLLHRSRTGPHRRL